MKREVDWHSAAGCLVLWLVRCFRDVGDAVVNGMGTIVDFAIEHLGLVWLATVVMLLFVAL